MEDRSNIIKEAIEYRKQLEKENAELKAENKELAHYLACMTEQRNRANTCLQEIKKIAEDAPAIDTELSLRILEVITKSESEEV